MAQSPGMIDLVTPTNKAGDTGEQSAPPAEVRAADERAKVESSFRQRQRDIYARVNSARSFFQSELQQKQQRRGARWISAHDEAERLHRRRGVNSWQARLLASLQSKLLQRMLTILLVTDIVCIVGELFLDAEFPPCVYVVRDAVSCCSSSHRQLGGGGGGHHAQCTAPLHAEPSAPAFCDIHKYDGAHTLHDMLFSISVTVLSCFQAELLLLSTALGSLFFRNPLYLLDSVVIASSLTLELWLHALGPAKLTDEDLSSFLVVGRLWRFLRIGHGIYATSHKSSEGKMVKMATQLKQLQAQLAAAGGSQDDDFDRGCRSTTTHPRDEEPAADLRVRA